MENNQPPIQTQEPSTQTETSGTSALLTSPPAKSDPKILISLIIAVAIIIGGYFGLRWYSSNLPIGPGLSPSPTASLTPTPGPTASWQTYRNEEYGFEVKYPEGWIFKDGLLRTKENKAVFFINTSETKFNSVIDWLNNEFSGDKISFKPKFNTVKIDNYDWIHYPKPISIGGCDEITVTIRKENLYEFQRTADSCSIPDEIFNQILSTFKFIE